MKTHFVPAIALALLLTATASGDPIVFLPGTGGSALRFKDSDQLYWVHSGLLKSSFLRQGLVNRQDLYASEVISDVASKEFEQLRSSLRELARICPTILPERLLDRVPENYPVYVDFLNWAYAEFGKKRFYGAPYDWRLRPAASLAGLDAVVERARRENGGTKVILLCHSLGGLVGREYIAAVGRGKVSHLITVGTPWLGTPQAARALVRGADFGFGVTLPNRLPGELNGIVLEIHAPVDDKIFGRLTRHSPTHISFVRRSDTRALAQSFPSLFLMSAGLESGGGLGRLLQTPSGADVGVVAEWTPAEFRDFLRRANPQEFEWALQWRSQYLLRESYGVEHHLVGLVSNAQAPNGESQVLRFSGLERPVMADISRSAPRAVGRVADGLGAFPIPGQIGRNVREIQKNAAEAHLVARRQLYRNLDRQIWLNLELDEFIPTHADRRWGDGTIPLYSATAGAVDELSAQIVGERAHSTVGPLTHISVVELSPGRSHMSALDDPLVRQHVLKIFNTAAQP